MANEVKAPKAPKTQAAKPAEKATKPAVKTVEVLKEHEIVDTNSTPEFSKVEQVVTETIEEVSTTPVEEEKVDLSIEPKSYLSNEKEGSNVVIGEAYIVRVNHFLPSSLSKYSVRLKTEHGYKELAKVKREKAFYIARNLNRANIFKDTVFIDE